jgi:hypothetical protein
MKMPASIPLRYVLYTLICLGLIVVIGLMLVGCSEPTIPKANEGTPTQAHVLWSGSVTRYIFLYKVEIDGSTYLVTEYAGSPGGYAQTILMER